MEEVERVGCTVAKRGFQPRRAVKCFVRTCDSKMGSVSRRNNISFHNFPMKQSLYLKWKRAIHNEDDPCDASKVCSLHFKEEDYRCPSLRKLRLFLLKPDAVPSQRLPTGRRLAPRQTRRQTRQQTRRAAVSTAKVEGGSSGEETLTDEDGPYEQWADPSGDGAKQAAGTQERGKRRKLHFSSDKRRNRARRVAWQQRGAANSTRAAATGKPRRATGDRVPTAGGGGGVRATRSAARPEAVRPTPPPLGGETFVALEMNVASPPPPPPVSAKPRSLPSFVLVRPSPPEEESKAAAQTCCVPGCTTQHKSVFSFPTEPRWNERWSKSIFGPPSRPPPPVVRKPSSEGLSRTVSRTGKAGSKMFVHSRQLRMPMAAYRALFTIPGLGTGGDGRRPPAKSSSMVCSAHFPDGRPTGKNPVPKLHLGARPEEWEEGEEVRPAVHMDHTYATLVVSIQTRPVGRHRLPTPPKQPPEATPVKQPPEVTPAARRAVAFYRRTPAMPPPAPATPPSGEEEIVIRRRGERGPRPKPAEPGAGAGAEKMVGDWDHTYADRSDCPDLEKEDHTYAFVITEVKNSDSTIWGQYSVSPLAQACYTAGPAESFTEDQDLFYATVKREAADEIEDDFDLTPAPLVADRCFASDWDRLSPTGDGGLLSVKREPPDADPFAPDDPGAGAGVKREPPDDECGSFHFVDVSNFMNEYRGDFEDLGSLDSIFAPS